MGESCCILWVVLGLLISPVSMPLFFKLNYMAQQTAVEWLEQEIDKVWKGDIMYMELPRDIYYKLIKNAKEIEKEQIVHAYRHGANDEFEHWMHNEKRVTAIGYYNRAYKRIYNHNKR
jgi:hypothetical protein